MSGLPVTSELISQLAQQYVRVNDEIGEWRTKEFMIVFGEHLRTAFELAHSGESDSASLVEKISEFFKEKLDELLPAIFDEHKELLNNSFRKSVALCRRVTDIGEVVETLDEANTSLFIRETIRAKLQNAFVVTESSKNLLEAFSLKPNTTATP